MKLWATAILFAVAGLAVGWFALPHWLASSSSHSLSVAAGCALHETPCVASAGPRRLHIRLAPTPVPVLQPVQVHLQAEGFGAVQQVQVQVEGVDMFMGYQFASLTPAPDGGWQGSFTLPVCTLERMEWRATVALKTASGEWTAAFPFATFR